MDPFGPHTPLFVGPDSVRNSATVALAVLWSNRQPQRTMHTFESVRNAVAELAKNPTATDASARIATLLSGVVDTLAAQEKTIEQLRAEIETLKRRIVIGI